MQKILSYSCLDFRPIFERPQVIADVKLTARLNSR